VTFDILRISLRGLSARHIAAYDAEHIQDCQKETILNNYASFFRRASAYVIDSVILFAGVLMTQGLIYSAGLNPTASRIANGETVTGWQLHLWVFLSVSTPFWLYFALLQSSAWQATVGQRLLGLQVADLTGNRLSFGRALLRAIVMLIPFEVNHAVLFHLGNFGPTSSGSDTCFLAGLWNRVGVNRAVRRLSAGDAPQAEHS